MTLEAIRSFKVPQHVVRTTEQELSHAGQQGYELFVLWSGVADGNVFHVRTCHVPQQTGYQLESGVCVRVDGDELHRLNRQLFDQNEILAIQLHTHPTQAYHSDTDDTFPIVTLLGGLSIVVPNFCRAGLATGGTAVYRLEHRGWIQLRKSAISRLLELGTA
jgi:hypothetical protein